ncbi:MAG TPA: hypothetical protein VM910_08460 [Bradyrhizobium sp.]|jgi:hypothetical protein|nr:hypothetical protein [Bradyrhizobium sp.]
MNGAQNLTEPVAAQAGPDASPRNRRDWTYFDERLSELRKNDVENIIARGRILIEANDELERGSYEATVKRHFDLSYARKLRIIAAHPVISNRAHVHALPPSVFTLYELTKLPAALLRETLNDGSINAKLERKDVARWRKGEGGKVAVDGKTVERKSLREQLKAAKVEIETLEAKLKDAGGGYFDLALDSAEHIGQQLAEHMSEARFDTAVKAAKARFKAKRQKPAG